MEFFLSNLLKKSTVSKISTLESQSVPGEPTKTNRKVLESVSMFFFFLAFWLLFFFLNKPQIMSVSKQHLVSLL